MRILLALLLLPAIAFGAEGDGRYEFVKAEGGQYLLDTKTGEIWMVVDNAKGIKIFIRAPFMQNNGKCSSAPDGNTPIPCALVVK